MNTADPVQNYTLYVSGGTISFTDTNYDYRYYRLVATGARSAVVNITLNGQTFNLAGATVIDAPIFSLTVNSGDGIVLFGTKSAKTLFGN